MRIRWLAAAAAFGCGTTTAPAPTPGACGASDALVAMSDYSSSEVGAIAGDGGMSRPSQGSDLGKDPALAVSHGRAFFVARQEGTIFELDPTCGTPVPGGKVNVNAPGQDVGANPQDVAVAPDGALWVPRYNLGNIAIVKGTGKDSLNLSAYDPDGNPQPSAIRIVDTATGPKAFVTLERLDDGDQLRSTRPSQILRIDVATRAVEATIGLRLRNPFNTIEEDSGGLFLAMPGNFDDAGEAEAGIERFDVASSTTRVLVREQDLGGSVAEVAVRGRCGAAILADATPTVNRTSLAIFDAETGAVLAKNVIAPSESFDKGVRGLTWTSGGRVLLVGDRVRQAKGYPVHAFVADDTCTLHATPDAVFLPQKPISVRAIE